MASVMGLHFSMQEEDVLEHIDVKSHLCAFLVNLQTHVWQMHTPRNTSKHAHVKVLASTLECQVACGDTNGDVC